MTVAMYNPHLLSKAEAIGQFIARKAMLARVLENLRTPAPSNVLFIGTRGMGKTTLLQRIGYAVEDDPDLIARYVPLRFPEEQYTVLRLDTFYLNALDSLSDRLEQEGDRSAAEELDRAVKEIDRQRDRADAARELLEATARKLNRRLLLLVDNADRVLDQLPDREQWSLRETLANSPHFAFHGASTQAIASQFTRDKAFHEFFRIEWMNPLKAAECEEILRELGKQSGASERIEKWIEEDPARLKTLIRLTGGNPRTIAILFGLVMQGGGGGVASELERLLDACTPAYKGRIEDLPPTAQAVLHGVAEHFDPVSASEVAAKVRIETTTVSSQLTRLIRMGLVEKTDAEETRVRYQIADRFFNIWYLMRQGRQARDRMRLLAESLQAFDVQPARAMAATASAAAVAARKAAQSRRLADLKLVAPEVREPAEAILRDIAPDLFD